MANRTAADTVVDMAELPILEIPTSFERLIACNPPILESLLAQLPFQSILKLYHTSPFLRQFLRQSPTSWRYISLRLYQPTVSTVAASNNNTGNRPRQSSNYALDQLLIYVINPFSTRLVSLELDNTAVSGGTLTQTVLVLRRDTLQHVSVRGCKNVSLKYHINPWLQMHALARERSGTGGPPGYEKLALKSLYTYRCRHHRRRPYLPSSLMRKESDSEPTHELVLTCHKLGIWTDTAWCTTPGVRCYRRRGYVTMRVPQDPREVWVVFDRLWRSRNWLGPVEQTNSTTGSNNGNNNNETTMLRSRKRKRDCRLWESEEEAEHGEAVGMTGEGKTLPAHLRQSHRSFVEDIHCGNCANTILERCEQCSVLMHCSGCRKTLCASCAFDRPYLRNQGASGEEKNRFWWAPGHAVSPCSMQDQDTPIPVPAANGPLNNTNALPNLRFKWCCTEPVFSGGGGITFASGSSREVDRIRAAPLNPGQGWEDADFETKLHSQLVCTSTVMKESGELDDVFGHSSDVTRGPGGRWSSIETLLRSEAQAEDDKGPGFVPRILCDECYASDQWNVKCKACSTALCVKHDVRNRLRARICGYRDLSVEKQELRLKPRQKAIKRLLTSAIKNQHEIQAAVRVRSTDVPVQAQQSDAQPLEQPMVLDIGENTGTRDIMNATTVEDLRRVREEMEALTDSIREASSDGEPVQRPPSRGSNSTGPPSRSSSPAPSAQSSPATPEPSSVPRRRQKAENQFPNWRGCQSFFCPPTRAPGDHRRRCGAAMRQCVDCKIHVCSDCVSSMGPPCLCQGCRAAELDGSVATTVDSIRFFCPNCRWARIQAGTCKRKLAPIAVPQESKKKKRRNKVRKPIEDRRAIPGNNGDRSSADDDMEGLVDFFEYLELQSRLDLPRSDEENQDDIQQLEDMGQMARDLIRRIQRLREQFRPGSLATLVLPDIRVADDESGMAALYDATQNQVSGATLFTDTASQPSAENAEDIE